MVNVTAFFRWADPFQRRKIQGFQSAQIIFKFLGVVGQNQLNVLLLQIFGVFRNVQQVQTWAANHQRADDRADFLGHVADLLFYFFVSFFTFSLLFTQFFILAYQVLEWSTQVLDSLQCRVCRYLEEFYQRINVGRLVVEGSSRQQQDFIVATQIMQQGIILRIFIAETMCLVNDNQKLLARFHQLLIMQKSLFYFSWTEHSSRKAELIAIAFPLLVQMRRTHNDGPQLQIAGDGRGYHTFAQTYHIGHNSAVMVVQSVQSHLDSIRLVS